MSGHSVLQLGLPTSLLLNLEYRLLLALDQQLRLFPFHSNFHDVSLHLHSAYIPLGLVVLLSVSPLASL